MLDNEKSCTAKTIGGGPATPERSGGESGAAGPSSFRGENCGGRLLPAFSLKQPDSENLGEQAAVTTGIWTNALSWTQPKTWLVQHLSSRRQQREQTLSFPRRSEIESSLALFFSFEEVPKFST